MPDEEVVIGKDDYLPPVDPIVTCGTCKQTYVESQGHTCTGGSS
jgi:hypothetical protein